MESQESTSILDVNDPLPDCLTDAEDNFVEISNSLDDCKNISLAELSNKFKVRHSIRNDKEIYMIMVMLRHFA